MKQRNFLLCVCLLIAAGCGGNTRSLPAPVEDRSRPESVVAHRQAERLDVAVENASAAISGAATGAGATIALLEQAQGQAQAGDADLAAATLERAIRIEPANPWPWHHLAVLRLQQGQLRQAIDIAGKSNSLAGDNARMIAGNNARMVAANNARMVAANNARMVAANNARMVAGNWEVIARAKDAQGDVAGAAAARRQRARYQP